jgi:glyoxylase-like metal-dependent hydrolase (beta-lactamase superfamily II)
MPFLRLSDHIYQVGGKALSHPSDCNVYLIDGRPQECVLIDCGTALGIEMLLDNVKEAGFDLTQVAAVINTHCHYCHAGGTFRLNKRLGYVEVIIHELDAMAVETGDPNLTGANLHGSRFEPCEVNVRVCTSDMTSMKTLGFGDKLLISAGDFELTPVHTPGHTPGSMSLYGKIDGKETLFAGDIGEKQLRQEWDSGAESSHSSILKLLELEIDRLYLGHDMIVENPRRWLESQLFAR